MSLTGGISFYDKSKCLFDDGARAVASSNTPAENLLLGTNKYFRWESIGSDDLTTETITITLPASVAISRIFLLKHNFKKFQIQYGSVPSDFTNVIGLDSYSDNKIDVTGFAREVAYFEFDSVTTDTLILTIDTTQVVDAEKYITEFICTNEIGTLTGYPQNSGVTSDRNNNKEKSITGRYHIQKSYESADFDLTLRPYSEQADINILDGLHDREQSFLSWLCGGLPDSFEVEQRGFRIEDLYMMQIDTKIKNSYYKNSHSLGVQQKYSFVETAT